MGSIWRMLFWEGEVVVLIVGNEKGELVVVVVLSGGERRLQSLWPWPRSQTTMNLVLAATGFVVLRRKRSLGVPG